MQNKVKLLGTLIGVSLFICLIVGLTYAYTVWQSNNMNKVVSSKCFDVLYTKGNDITGPIIPSDTYIGGTSSTFKVNIKDSCDINARGKLYLNTSDSTSSNLYREGLLNYQVVQESTLIKGGNITSSGEIEIDLGELTKASSAMTNYTVYVWIDRNLVENSDYNLGYAGNIRVEAIQFK